MRELTYAQALNEALQEEMSRDPRIIIMGEDIGHYGGVYKVTKDLFTRYGAERVRDTPISEAGFVGAGLGAAMTGLRPIVELMYIDFTLVAMDQIVNQIAKARYMSGGQVQVPMVIRTQGGGGRGNGAQHSQSLEAMFAHMPGIKVVIPATPGDAKGLLKTAIRDDNPVLFIENKMLYTTKGPVPEGEHLIPLGKAEVKRSGTDVTVVTWSRTVYQSLEAAEQLASAGISVEVIDLRTIVPMDLETIYASVAKTHRLVIAHEAHGAFGPGAEIAARVQQDIFDELDAPVVRVATMDIPLPFNRRIEADAMVSTGKIVAGVRDLLEGREVTHEYAFHNG